MARPDSKDSLIAAAQSQYNKLLGLLDAMPSEEQNASFVFEDRDRNCRDVLVHLVEWHTMLLRWESANRAQDPQPFLPPPHTWKTTAALNEELRLRNQGVTLDQALDQLARSHAAVLDLIDSYSNEELFTKKHFPWTGTTSLGSYCVSATSSHYDWAMKKLRKHRKTFLAPAAGI